MSNPARKRITAHDVAARAGVSQPTVSLVLSGNPNARVAQATRARVLEAARELGYKPNLLARGLVQRRSYALGIIIPDLDNPFFTEVVSGAERVAAEAGYAVLLCDRRETSLARHLETLQSRQVDGILMDAASAATLGPAALGGLDITLIDEPAGAWPGVATDAAEAGRRAAEHLIALGHRAVGFIGPATDTYTFRMRERGFVEALRAAGLPIRSSAFRRAPATVAGGREAMRELIAARVGVTAVFCANDLIALGALKTCLTAGVAVPRQMSIVGCDDIEMARVVTPELTTVRIPARGLGALAVRELLRRIEGRAGKPSSGKLLPVELVVRGTTAAAPAEGAA